MAMIFNESNKLYCTYCRHAYAGGPESVFHPVYDSLATWIPATVVLGDPDFLNRLKACPHAGRHFAFPEAGEL